MMLFFIPLPFLINNKSPRAVFYRRFARSRTFLHICDRMSLPDNSIRIENDIQRSNLIDKFKPCNAFAIIVVKCSTRLSMIGCTTLGTVLNANPDRRVGNDCILAKTEGRTLPVSLRRSTVRVGAIACPAIQIPSFSHIASTRALTSLSIEIGVPHWRVVSPGHLLVASMAIFDPRPETGLAKSR